MRIKIIKWLQKRSVKNYKIVVDKEKNEIKYSNRKVSFLKSDGRGVSPELSDVNEDNLNQIRKIIDIEIKSFMMEKLKVLNKEKDNKVSVGITNKSNTFYVDEQ